MQFKNLLVAKKIWVLLTVVVVLLLGAMGTMASYMTQLEDELRAHVLEMEGRSQLALRLLGATEAGATAVVTAHFARDVISERFFEQRAAELQQTVNRLFQDIERRVDSAEGKAILDKVRSLRSQTQAVMHKMREQEQRGEEVDQTVRSEMTPIVTNLLQELENLVVVQQQRVKQSMALGDTQRRQALLAVALAVAVILAAAMLLSRWLVRQVTEPLQQAVELADEIAQGNLTRDIRVDSKDEMGMLLAALQRMTERLRSLVGDVRDGVAAVSTASEQIEQGNQNLSTRTEETAANLEETAASMEELTANLKQAADTAQQANQLASSAAQAAERGGEVMHQVVMSMDQINTASRKINDIIGVIDGIAFQTNILALNAAVEAARAGEQGRGFAVVASEVRGLAQRSADAAKEIKALIHTSVVSVEHGAQQVQQAGENMQDIVQGVRRVTDLIAEMSASAHEQRDGISQVNHAVSNLDQMTQQNAALVEESGAAAISMNEQAQRLAQVVAQFRLGEKEIPAFTVARISNS